MVIRCFMILPPRRGKSQFPVIVVRPRTPLLVPRNVNATVPAPSGRQLRPLSAKIPPLGTVCPRRHSGFAVKPASEIHPLPPHLAQQL